MALQPSLMMRVVAVAFALLARGLDPAAAAGFSQIRVALEVSGDEVMVTSGGPILATAPGVRRTVSGAVHVVREGSRVLINGQPLKGPVRLVGRSAPLEVKGVSVRGAVVAAVRGDALSVVNELALEDYVKSVVPSEVPAIWPFEALKAQAILARTYALYHKQERTAQAFDVDATVQSQVYGGLASEDPRTSRAVAATAGLVVTHRDGLALTPYHSTSAGPTEDAAEVWGIDLPYLKGVACPFDLESPVYRWNRSLSLDALESTLREAGYAMGPIATLTPLTQDQSGRVSAIRILHARGELMLMGETLRRLVGYQRLPSMRFNVVDFEVGSQGIEARLVGGGWGHGVGLCQWGMKTLAERGWSAARIVSYYYPGTSVEHVASIGQRGR
jgi:stage II sporulation protein D